MLRPGLERTTLDAVAREVGLDLAEAARLDIGSPPTLCINGVRLPGASDFGVYRAVVEAELSRSAPSNGVQAGRGGAP